MDRNRLREAMKETSGPAALVFVEDREALDATFGHHLGLGFGAVIAFAPADAGIAGTDRLRHVPWHRSTSDETDALNAAIAAAEPGRWLAWGYNAEFLFFPFSATRSVAGLLSFQESERRASVFATVVDLYPGDEGGLCDPGDAWFDRTGYISERPPAPDDGELHLYGGLRRRFSEHVPPARRRIDRIALFRARHGLRMDADLRLSDPGLRTDACPWHRNATAAVVSFHAAKALRTNPASRAATRHLRWPGSERFRWSDAQLMEHGLMEPGQWF